MKHPTYLYSFLLSLLILLTACEEVIQIRLDEDEEKLVINGIVEADKQVHQVEIYYANSFYDQGEFEGVSEAIVQISDNLGNTEQLQERAPGLYETSDLLGVAGRTYTLSVMIEDENYSAEAYLQPAEVVDSVNTIYIDQVSIVPEIGYYLRFYAQDDADLLTHYLMKIYVNDTLYDDGLFPFLVFDGRFAQGQYINGFIIPLVLEQYDSVTAEFSSLTTEGYDYYSTLVQQINAGSPFGAPPSNLPGNISNGALGFFRASTIQVESLVIE